MNPLIWLHQRITGSARTIWIVTGAYALVILLFFSGTQYLTEPRSRDQTVAAWLGIVSAGQALFLLLLVPSAVRKAVLKDFQSSMIESHRVSPMSSLRIVLGYLAGPAVQHLLLAAVGCVFATYFLVRVTSSLGIGGIGSIQLALLGWYGALFCLMVLSLMVSALVLLVALASNGKATVVGLLIGACGMGGWIAVIYVPGLALLSGVMATNAIYQFATRGAVGGNLQSVFVGSLLQAALAAILVWSACRVVRSPHRSIFSVPSALILTLLIAAILVAGVALATDTLWMRRDFKVTSQHQIVASVIAYMFTSLLAINSAAVDRALLDRAAFFGVAPSTLSRRICDLTPVACGLTGFLVLLVMVRVLPDRLWSDDLLPYTEKLRVVPIAISQLCFAWIAYQFYYRAATRRGRTVWLALAVCVLLAVVPSMVDSWIDAYYRDEFVLDERALKPGQSAWPMFGWISATCPLGTLSMAGGDPARVWFGVVVQIAIAAAATGFARLAKRSLARVDTYESVRTTAAGG